MTQSLIRPRTGAALFFSLLSLGSVARAQVGYLGDKEQQALGKTLSKFLSPKSDEKDREKARVEFASSLEKIGKKRGAKETQDAHIAALTLTADLGRAMFHAAEYKSSLRGGKPINEEIGALSGSKTTYALSLPSTYRAGATPLPLVLCIPEFKDGKPVSPAEFLASNLNEQEFREGAVLAAVPMPASHEAWNTLGEDRMGGVAMVMYTWGDVFSKVGIDADRIYLLGRGTEAVSAAMNVAARYPHRFAGVIGMSGDAAEGLPATNFRNLPTFFVGAGGNATAFEAQCKEAGFENCTLKADGTAADVWAWISKTTRVANPLKVTFMPGDPIPDRAYWVRIPGTAGLKTAVVAEADPSTNTLKLTVPDVRSVTVYLNSALIDFSKPANIEINGKMRTEKIVPSVDDMLNLLGTSDNGRVYVTQRTYEVTH